MQSIRQSCAWAARSPTHVCVYAHASRRAFSRSSAHSRGALPVFLTPSSPELSTLLATLNAKILLPAHLTKEQQKLVYRLENKPKLEAEPVEITLGEVTLPLEHLDRNKLPNQWHHLSEILNHSTTAKDWENVVRLLEGFENAGLHIKPQRKEAIVRNLHRNGMHHLVLKALQRPRATGLRLSDQGVLTQVLRSLHDIASIADWAEAETTRALRMARQVVEMMDDDEHCATQMRRKTISEHDWRSKPAVVALPTELAAVLADRHGGDVDEVKRLANRLVNAMKQQNFHAELDTMSKRAERTSKDFQSLIGQVKAVSVYSLELVQLVIVWNALKTSRKVLGTDMPMADEAQIFETQVEAVIRKGLTASEKLLERDGERASNTFIPYIWKTFRGC